MYTEEEPASRKPSFAMSGLTELAESPVPGRLLFFVVFDALLAVKRKGGEVGVFGVGLGDGCRWRSFTISGVETVGGRVW